MIGPRRRRPLGNVGGAIEREGDPAASEALAAALDVQPTSEADAPDRAHVHGFHSYPARTHPVSARRLIEAFAPQGGTVLDPFCGSGTILVEAMLAGRDAVGTDLNPLAVMLARAKTYPRACERTASLVEGAREVAAYADARRKAKAGASRRLPREDVAMFAPHVLLELDGLRAGIERAPAEHRPELGLVLSSILVKVAQKRGDTSEEPVEKRVSAGYPARLFLRKTEELARRMDEFADLLPSPAPRARVFQDDATVLAKVKAHSIDAVVTSPPYAATYDYLAHHELRLRWLGLDAGPLARGELGARRSYEKRSPGEAKRMWEQEVAKLLDALARVTKEGGSVVLLIADSATAAARGGTRREAEALRADEVVARAARDGDAFRPVARASQARPHFHDPTASAFAERPRLEHALLLRRGKSGPRRATS